MVVIVAVRLEGHHLTTCIRPTLRTHTMGPAWAMATRALVHGGRVDLVVGATQSGAAVRLLFLGNGHRRNRLPGPAVLGARASIDVSVARPDVVEVAP